MALLAGAAALPSRALRAQGAGGAWRIGVLEIAPASSNMGYFGAFLTSMRELGYVEGRDFTIEYRHADLRPERFAELAAELVRLKVDLILTRGTPATLAAKAATDAIPIVMFALGEPLLVVASLARPGGNVTGLSAFANDLAAKRVEVMKELVPNLARIAFMHNMGNPVAPPAWDETRAGARSIGVEPQLLDVSRAEDLEPAFEAARRERADGLIVALDALTEVNRAVLAELAARRRLPALYPTNSFIEAGGLIAYGVNFVDLYRRTAAYVDRILKGARPGDLPVEQPTKFELIVNLKAAKTMGLAVPPALLARADEVIE
jgi:putative tryptophan/tyrosine transport system substrate-binding protein